MSLGQDFSEPGSLFDNIKRVVGQKLTLIAEKTVQL
jgi:hypothetical protein